MSGDEVYDAWAPEAARWSPWAKPVLFAYAGSAAPVRAEDAARDALRPRVTRLPAPRDAPEAERDAPEAERDAPEAERDAPEAPRDAPEAERDAPEAEREAPEAPRDAPEAPRDALPAADEGYDARVPPADGLTALVADLPGAEGVRRGLALAAAGYRPVPLYNSVPAPVVSLSARAGEAVLDVWPVVAALRDGARHLNALTLPPDAPPAFLLDARRRVGDGTGAVRPGSFDNRSVSLPTDFPSANLLLSAGVRRVLLVLRGGDGPQPDLSHTLRRWQDAGLEILALRVDLPDAPRPITVPRPPRFRHLWHALLARLGLRRSPLGGYGGYVPEPSTG